MGRSASSRRDAARKIAAVTMRHENTRVLVALNQAADQEPALKEVFNELLKGFGDAFSGLLKQLRLSGVKNDIDLLHAVFVGLSVIDLATSRPNGEARARAVLDRIFNLLSGEFE